MAHACDVDALLADLTEPQRQAVLHTDGPLLVLAGAGSGKTRVITRRAAHLAATVTEPFHVLAITFTNKAAGEMRERIAALCVGPGMQVSTFHAWCAKTLRIYADRAGLPRNFTILDREDRRKVLKDTVERCGLSATNWKPAALDHAISRAKNDLLTAAQYATTAYDFVSKTTARIYEAYEAVLRETDCLDFDDLLMRMALLLERDEALRDELEDRHRYVLIDEYQDTNTAQYRIARLLTKRQRNLCATGDPDQSIYGWRGANIENILHFEQDYPDATVVRLEQNYRSTKRILAAADALISRNARRKKKGLWTENAEGARVRVMECDDAADEARTIARDISNLLRSGVDPGQIAVFYRINSLSRSIEEALIARGVRYQVARGVEYYNRKEIKDVLAYLRVLVNPADQAALERIINVPPRGIGDTTVTRLVEAAQAAGRPLLEHVLGGDGLEALGRSAAKVREFAALIEKLRPLTALPARDALEAVVSRTGLRAHYAPEENPDSPAGANLDELINAAAGFQQTNPEATILDWLEHTALVSDVDAVQDGAGAVTLMTLHAAKGLEFPHVYIVGLEENLLPLRRDGEHDDADQEEERRLCFVGMTRAQERLTLSLARYRMMRGVTQRTARSAFLDELPYDQLEWVGLVGSSERLSDGYRAGSSYEYGSVGPRRARWQPVPSSDETRKPARDLSGWSVGTLVRHPKHGLGQVVSLERGAARTHALVEFQSGLRSSWILEFAQLERVDYDEVG